DDDAACLQQYFHAVFVHSDPAFARADESMPPAVPVYYTGFVRDRMAEAAAGPRPPQGSLVGPAGSEPWGDRLGRNTIAAHARLPGGMPPLTIVAAPETPEAAWRRLQAVVRSYPRAQLRRYVPHLASELRRAAGSLSDCSYHAAANVLRSQVPAVVVPFG